MTRLLYAAQPNLLVSSSSGRAWRAEDGRPFVGPDGWVLLSERYRATLLPAARYGVSYFPPNPYPHDSDPED